MSEAGATRPTWSDRFWVGGILLLLVSLTGIVVWSLAWMVLNAP